MKQLFWGKFLFLTLLCFTTCLTHAAPDLQQQLKTSEIQLGQLSQQMSTLNQQLSDEQKKLEKLKEEQQPFLAQLAMQQKALMQQTKLIYQLGQIQSLKTLLNPDDINTINRHLYYYHYLGEARLRLVGEIKGILNTIATNMSNISQQEQKLKDLLNAKQQQQQQQQNVRAERQNIIAQLQKNGKDTHPQLAASAANRRTLQNTLSSLKTPPQAPLGKKTFDQLHGRLRWPIQGAIVANYGTWLSNQRLPGVIIKAPEGTPVHAVYKGKVIFASWLRGFGLLVIINHGNGFMSLYARNHALFAKVGDIVKPRDVIATIGNSGGYTKSSLYFEIRQNGTPINPQSWCR
jgi:septal ring factor EnvC (AmiA/AmiB activator)